VIILLDTDVLIDVALDRAPHSEPAAALLDWCEQHPKSAYIAWHSIANFYYLVRPKRGHDDTKSYILDLINFVEVAQTGTADLAVAVQLAMKDFEDAMQVAAVLTCKADVIATRNIRDYSRAPVRAMLPLQLITEL
jgi:predicted nucleic acid-binding protein